MTDSVAAGGVAPAGHVKDHNDVVLGLLDAEQEHAPVRQEYFEGRPLSEPERQLRQFILKVVMREVSTRLTPHSVHILGCYPEEMGFGARFVGRDDQGRDYRIDYRWDDQHRLGLAAIDSTSFVREMVADICEAIVAEKANYLRRGGMAR